MLIGKYDTRSITHYPAKVNEHIKNIKPRNVIIPKKCSPEGCEFGQRYELSQLDVIHLALLYNCSKFKLMKLNNNVFLIVYLKIYIHVKFLTK